MYWKEYCTKNITGLEDVLNRGNFGRLIFWLSTIISWFLMVISLSMTDNTSSIGTSFKEKRIQKRCQTHWNRSNDWEHDLRASRLKIKHKGELGVIQGSHGRSQWICRDETSQKITQKQIVQPKSYPIGYPPLFVYLIHLLSIQWFHLSSFLFMGYIHTWSKFTMNLCDFSSQNLFHANLTKPSSSFVRTTPI